MINVREGTFETNSSSTHSMVIVEDSQLQKWKNGDIWYVPQDKVFVNEYTKNQILEKIYGIALIDHAERDFANVPEIVEAIKEKKLKEYIKEMIDNEEWYVDEDEIPQSYEEFFNKWHTKELEEDNKEYITPKGEKIHIFCQYGYDG